jgi:hypothetical protein
LQLVVPERFASDGAEMITLTVIPTNDILAPMDPRPEPEQPALTLQLARDVYYQVVHTLRATLPPVSDQARTYCGLKARPAAVSIIVTPANEDGDQPKSESWCGLAPALVG